MCNNCTETIKHCQEDLKISISGEIFHENTLEDLIL